MTPFFKVYTALALTRSPSSIGKVVPGDDIIRIGVILGESAPQFKSLGLGQQGRRGLGGNGIPNLLDKHNPLLAGHLADSQGLDGWRHVIFP